MLHVLTTSILGLGTLAAPPPQSPVSTPGAAIETAGLDYRARFTPAGATFAPHADKDSPPTPVHFALAEVRVGDTVLPLAACIPSRTDDVVALDHGNVVEEYAIRPDGIEQRYRFAALPHRDTVRLRIAVTTARSITCTDAGLRFVGGGTDVTYGAAVAIDATGRRADVTTRIVDGGLELVVAGEFVATAALPLVVDPLITSAQTILHGPMGIGIADAAFDPVTNRWLAVFAVGSGTQHAIYGQILDELGAPVGELFLVLGGGRSWDGPQIARHGSNGKFLVVAEAIEGTFHWVAGAMLTMTAAGVTAAPMITIAKAGVAGAPSGNYARPDVGGDGDTAADGRFCVVYERQEFGAYDVHLRQVAADGTLVGAAPTLLASSSLTERAPRISRTNGRGPAGTQTWGVVYERDLPGSASAFQIWTAMVRRDGSLRSLLGQSTWLLSDETLPFRTGFDISSPTDDVGGVRYLLAVEPRWITGQSWNVFGHLITHQGLGGAPVDLSQLEAPGSYTVLKAQMSPVVDCDGTRFTVGHVHVFTEPPQIDDDVYVSTFARSRTGELVVQEARAPVATSVDDEPLVAICARHSGGGLPGRYLAFHTRQNGVEVYLRSSAYEGLAPGGVSWRATGCGSVTMLYAGTPGLAMPVSFTLTGATGVRGFLVGAATDIPLAPLCNGCTLGTTGDVVLGGTVWAPTIPNDVGLVSAAFAVQGYDLAATGPCVGQVHLTHTAIVTMR